MRKWKKLDVLAENKLNKLGILQLMQNRSKQFLLQIYVFQLLKFDRTLLGYICRNSIKFPICLY